MRPPFAVSSSVGAGAGSAKQKRTSRVARSFQQMALSPPAGMANDRPGIPQPGFGCAFCSPIKRYQSLGMQICPRLSLERMKYLSRRGFVFDETTRIIFLKNIIVEELFL
jgi:hypothetical protein